MSGRSAQFGRVPYALGNTDIIARMKPSDAKVYLAMALHADKRWQVKAGLRRVAKIAGVQLGTVSEAVRRLETLGAISIDWPGNGHSAVYTLTVQQIPNGLPFSTHRTGKQGNRSAHTGGTVQQAPAKPFSACRTKQSEQRKNRAQAAPAAGAGAPHDGDAAEGRGGKRSRRRDEVFETLAEVCGMRIDQLTKTSRGQLNKAVKELREVGADPMQIRQRAAVYRRTFQRAKLTPSALAKHWPQLAGSDTTDSEFAIAHRNPTDDDLATVAAAKNERAAQ